MRIDDSLERKPRVIFLSITNIKSTKAYTITTKRTLEAVTDYGFSTILVAPDLNIFDNSSQKSKKLSFLQIVMKYARQKFDSQFFLSRFLHFIIFEVSFLLILRRAKVLTDTDAIWTRSYLAPLILGSKYRYLIEIHQPLSFWSRSLLRAQRFISPNIVLAPISCFLENQILSLSIKVKKVMILPMSIDKNFLNLSPLVEKPEFKIGYFGSLRVNSENQGIFELIEQLIVCSVLDPEFKCLMVGLSETEIEEIKEYLKSQNKFLDCIFLSTRVEHSLVPNLMQKCEYLVLPYPNVEFHAARFPLKSLEYAASFRTILASDTIGHRNIFSDEEVYFYDQQDRFSIHKVLKSIEVESKLKKYVKSIKAHEKALGNTYSRRAEMGLKALSLF